MAKDDNSESQTKGENRNTEREEGTCELFAFHNADAWLLDQFSEKDIHPVSRNQKLYL